MNFKTMLMSAALMTGTMQIHAQDSDAASVVVEKPRADLSSGRLTPESLWSMGRIGNVSSTTDGKVITYAVTYYDIKSNKGNSVIYVKDLQTDKTHALFNGGNSPVFIKNGKEIAATDHHKYGQSVSTEKMHAKFPMRKKMLKDSYSRPMRRKSS